MSVIAQSLEGAQPIPPASWRYLVARAVTAAAIFAAATLIDQVATRAVSSEVIAIAGCLGAGAGGLAGGDAHCRVAQNAP
jgi:hypothetical protein